MNASWYAGRLALLLAASGPIGCVNILGDFTDSGTASPDGSLDSSMDGKGSFDVRIDSTVPDATSENTKSALGVSCRTDAECASGHCTDGVCCDSACNGICEMCNLSGSLGQCAPVPANTDPQKECVSAPAADAGPADSSGGSDGGTDAGAQPDAGVDASGVDAQASSPDASDGGEAGAAAEGGATDSGPDAGFNVPDGAITIDDTLCAGTCNGQRACAFPGLSTDCGTKFCNTTDQSGRFACDGTGHCGLDLQACVDYTCAGTGCGTSCTSPSDCLSTSFCSSQGICKPRFGNGVACTLDNQCQTGHCVQGVCCSSDCNYPGGTCTASGSVGECKCNVNCSEGGTCQLFYRDADADGYGDAQGTTANGNAVVACSNAQPSGFVADHTDCDDHDANVHPGQTGWYTAPSAGVGTFDYNCDATIEKEYGEYPGATCTFCGTYPGCASQSTCAAANDTAVLACGGRTYLCGISPLRFCFGCGGPTAGFTFTVSCGATAAYTTCGSCTAAGGGAAAPTTSTVQQACH